VDVSPPAGSSDVLLKNNIPFQRDNEKALKSLFLKSTNKNNTGDPSLASRLEYVFTRSVTVWHDFVQKWGDMVRDITKKWRLTWTILVNIYQPRIF
jgi:hypothetical protein